MKDLQKAWRNIAQDQIKNDESGFGSMKWGVAQDFSKTL